MKDDIEFLKKLSMNIPTNHSQDKITKLIEDKEAQLASKGLFDNGGKFNHLSSGERTLLAAQYVSIDIQQKDMSDFIRTYKNDRSEINRKLSNIEFIVR